MAAKKDDFSVKKISPKLGGERGTWNPNGPTSSHDLVEQMQFLYVAVIRFRNYSAVNPITTSTCIPVVEITLGNYKSSTETLQIGPKMDWNQVFAFDKTKGDVLSVTLKVKDTEVPKSNTVIGKQNFKLAADIPSRAPPDARIAAQWYSLKNTEAGHDMDLLMSIWFGTQADEVYSETWFSDASEVSASCVINTRPKVYLAPRLSYIRVTIVSGHDLISNDGKRPPSVYVKATLGKFALKTDISSGSNPSWNQDLIFVAPEPFDDIVYIELMDRVDDQHEECIGKLKKKLSEMTPLKVPGAAPVMFYDIEPPVKVEPAGDTRRFASRIKMKLANDQAYHVSEECIQYKSDYRAFAKGLWPGLLGKLEIGILGATGLPLMKDWTDGKKSLDAYVVAKYGNKWARTRTVVNSVSPKWNEQYSWDVYERCTIITLGVYDNCQIVVSNNNHTKDVPIGKVRIPLNKLEWDTRYTCSIPIIGLGKQGLKKPGELQLAIRLVCLANMYPKLMAPFRWMYPKAHYKSPLGLLQIEDLRGKAVSVNCMNLAKTEPPLREEVVMDILKPNSRNFSMRRTNANFARLGLSFQKFYSPFAWLHENVRATTDNYPKIYALVAYIVIGLLTARPDIIMWILCSWLVGPILLAFLIYKHEEIIKLANPLLNRLGYGTRTVTPSLTLVDMKLSQLESPSLDQLAEEFDSVPSSETDLNVIKMRYDRLRKFSAKEMALAGDIASQLERIEALWSYPLVKFFLAIFCLVGFVLYYCFPYMMFWFSPFFFYWVNFPCTRNDLPTPGMNFFRRLPTNEDLMF